MTEDLAIFIDWENIYISTVTEYSAKPNVSAILEKAREYGRIVSATAYADWTDGDFRDAPRPSTLTESLHATSPRGTSRAAAPQSAGRTR